jgi:hypothetical protein
MISLDLEILDSRTDLGNVFWQLSKKEIDSYTNMQQAITDGSLGTWRS